ncbi:hypothetical protein [Salinibacter ruber]|uniref:hypothetical protein n=1 Tax=Salinibacter ruber TaxID=146919 RepID=UPI0015E130CB|nr:hypothetical protein [Salinibacter ruber]MCS3610066.1 hypothetical protein [Salinibacter ruber]MCS3648116.1 hypothetical protein [Salinibacter ruber]
MDTAIIGMHSLSGVWLQARCHQESAQHTLVDAEITTIALTAARFFAATSEPLRRCSSSSAT